jgi:hypothetical protein
VDLVADLGLRGIVFPRNFSGVRKQQPPTGPARAKVPTIGTKCHAAPSVTRLYLAQIRAVEGGKVAGVSMVSPRRSYKRKACSMIA